jgi:hypothetical protein
LQRHGTLKPIKEAYVKEKYSLVSSLRENHTSRFDAIKHRKIRSIFHELQIDLESGSFMNAIPLLDRKALNEVIFKALGFTDSEVKVLYAGFLELTPKRLRKARIFTN